jgi:hypothetical protein
MMLLRFLFHLFTFIGALAAAGALVVSIVLMLRFPPLMIAVGLACWLLNCLLKLQRKISDQASPTKNSSSQ